MVSSRRLFRESLGPTFLVCFCIVSCCVSLASVGLLHDPSYSKIYYDEARLAIAVAVVAAFALVSPIFLFARFSFGYFLGFYFYTMVAGFLWLTCFSKFNYDHTTAAISAAASAIAFLLPALFITSPIKQVYALSAPALARLLTFILILSAVTIAISATYNFRLVSFTDIYGYRDQLDFPASIRYLTGIITSTLLPFAFACFLARKEYWHAAAALLLLLLLYPITLSKLALFAPIWLVGLVFLSRFLAVRTIVILSLLVPTFAGLVLVFLFKKSAAVYFNAVNFRMIATPSQAIDIYNDFFATHELTYFCQIRFLKPFVSCPYQGDLSVVMAKIYGLGNFNASLFATEGIASVGPLFAPVAVLACGFVIALANRLSAGLPDRFILASGAILPQVFLNVPMTTVMLTHGAGLLFLLWYITPRTMFDEGGRANALAN
jgi:hypothetical protein